MRYASGMEVLVFLLIVGILFAPVAFGAFAVIGALISKPSATEQHARAQRELERMKKKQA